MLQEEREGGRNGIEGNREGYIYMLKTNNASSIK
jgi:hypothetical protein